MARNGLSQPVIDKWVAAIQKSRQTPEWKAYLRQVTQLDGFQGPAEFKAQLLQDVREIEAMKKKLGL